MRSKFLIVPILFCISIHAQGQFKKGTRMIGTAITSGSYSSGTTDYTYPSAQGYSADNTSFNLSISPSYGVFVNASTVIGISLLVTSSSQKINNKSISDTIFSSSKSNNTDLGLGGFARYYINTSNKFAPFLHLFVSGGTGFGRTSGFSFGTDAFGSYKDSYTGKSSGRSFFNTGLNIGFTKMFNQQVGLDAFAGYVFSYSKISSETSSLRDYVNGADVTQEFQPTQKFRGNGVSFGIGLQVFL